MDEILNGLIQDSIGKPITHTKLTGGKLHIPEKHQKAVYKKIVKHGFVDGETIPLVERIGEYHPVLIDIDLKYETLITDRQYGEDIVRELVTMCWGVLSEALDIPKDNEGSSSTCMVLEKPTPYPCKSKGFLGKDGIHMVFPEIVLDRTTNKQIISYIQAMGYVHEIFQRATLPPSNNPQTLIDAGFSSWLPYGCSKPNEKPYVITRVYALSDGTVQPISEAMFAKYYSNTPENNVFIAEKMSVSYRKKEECRFTHSSSYKPMMEAKGLKIVSNNQAKMEPVAKKRHVYGKNKDIDKVVYRIEGSELELVRRLVKCLNVDRADDYEKWVLCGMCLHNINPDLLDSWKEFSALSDSYDEDACDRKWTSFNNHYDGQRLGLGSLKHWAKCDNEDAYKQTLRESLSEKLNSTIFTKFAGPDAHFKVNEVIFKYFENQFISVNIDDDWYHFNGTRWVTSMKATKLKECIHREIWDIYAWYSTKLRDEKNDLGADICLDFQKKLLKEPYVKTLISGLGHMFYVDGIMEKFDSNMNLVGFENGVYDLKAGEFREGRPEDYITMSNHITLPVKKEELPLKLDQLIEVVKERITDYDDLREDLDDFLAKILPETDLRDYTMRFLGKCLSGENRDEGFYIWTGSGGNGKSKLVELGMKCFGDYGCNLPVSLLTQKRKASGAANPEMARTRGRRFVVMQEPDVNETLNIGEMKEITGNDTIQARGLYKEPFEFTPQFKLVLMCNELPKIPANDNGTWRRLEAVPFISRFVKERDVDEGNHRYLVDRQLKDKLPEWKEVFVLQLLQEWTLYDTEGIHIPHQVTDKTTDYRNSNDIVGQWIASTCEIADNITQDDGVTQRAPTPLKGLFTKFKTWASEDQQLESKEIPNKKKFAEEILNWQELSKFGLSLGTPKQPRVNGHKGCPLINLKVV